MKTGLWGFQQGLNRAVTEESWKLKIWLHAEEELYYPCSENKGADQLCSYCIADLHLCFCIDKNLFFSWHSSYGTVHFSIYWG